MAYGFNDDRSKAPMYTKQQIDDKIDGELDVYGLHGNNSMTLVKAAGKSILIDVSSTSDADRIEAFLSEKLSSQLDYVVISHMHHDHCTGYQSVIQFCSEDTVWYRCMDCTDEENDYYSTAIDLIDEINAALSANGMADMAIPANGSIVDLDANGDAYLQFWNTDPSYEQTYKNSMKECDPSINPEYVGKPSYNNYSLITRVQHGNSSYVDCGDIEVDAQILNASDMRQCTIMKNPHHFANYMGYWKFFGALDPQYIYYSIYNNNVDSHWVYSGMGLEVCYTYRYLTQIDNILVYSNYETEFAAHISDGVPRIDSGFLINSMSGDIDFSYPKTVRGIFPPARKWYSNPNKLLECTLHDFTDWLIAIPAQSFPIIATTESSYYCDAAFMDELRVVFNYDDDIEDEPLVVYMDQDCGILSVSRPFSRTRQTKAIIYSTFDADDFPDTGCRIITEQTTRTPTTYTLTTPQGRDTSTTLVSLGVPEEFFMNDSVIAVTENNVMIPLARCTNKVFKGCVSGGGGTDPSLYLITIDNGRVFACYSCTLVSNVITERKIAKFINPYSNVYL